MDKVKADGKVAVLVSTGFGAGWSTWNREWPAMLFDPVIVEMVLAGKDSYDIEAVAERRWPDAYLGGVHDLYVAWIPEGMKFRVMEYDGAESILTVEDEGWIVA